MPAVEPKVGQFVEFWENVDLKDQAMQPTAAIITYVWGPESVNLTVFHHNGAVCGYTSVPIVQEGAEAPKSPERFCAFPVDDGTGEIPAGDVRRGRPHHKPGAA